MKGVDPLVSHALFISITIIAVIMIIVGVFNFNADIQKTSIQIQLDYIAEHTKGEILDLYYLSKNGLLDAEIKLTLPDKIANNIYEIELNQNGLKIKFGENEIERKIDIDYPMSGSSSLPAYLKLKNNVIVIE